MTERYALTFVEIDIPVCDLTYGVAPCEAELGVTGDIKCFNCLSTCQDRENYSETEVTLRFAMPADYLDESGIEAIPIITGIDFSPAIISLGEDLGQRASLTVNMKDIRWSDTGPGYDPYASERPYDPYLQGTYWGKFRARQPFLRGRNIRRITGFLGQALEEMETRHYIVESFNGPTPDGAYSIIAKDVLKLADGDRAQAPALSNGFLAAGISASATSATLSPTGIGNEKYEPSGELALGGKEIVSFTRSGDTLTLTGRGLRGTAAQAHAAQDRVQTVLRYSAEGPAEIIRDLLVTYAGVPSGYIDLAAWQTEASAFNARLYTATIAEPTSVNTLVSELIEQAGLAVWWDDVDQKIRLQVLRQIATDAERFADENVMKDTLSIEEQPERRLSQVWTYYGKINPLEGQEDPDNYRSTAITVDLDAEDEYGSPAIRKIFSRWIPDGGRTIATRINDILLGRFRDPPRRFTFSVFREEGENAPSPTLGEGCVLNAWPLQDASGARVDVPIQLVRLNPTDTDFRVTADEMRFSASADDPSIRDLVFDASINGVNIRTSHDSLYPDPVGGETVNVTVEEGAIIGATAYGSPALDVGTWPSITFSGTRTSGSAVVAVADTSAFKVGMAVSGPGFTGYRRVLSIVTNTSITLDADASANGAATLTLYTVVLNLIVRGRLQGAGGPGGAGAYFVQGPNIRTTAESGSPGTMALYTRYPLNLILNQGLGRVWGGGGGGGGAGVLALSNHAGGPGGGGAGVPGGAPGPQSNSGTSTSAPGSAGSVDTGGPGGSSFASFSWAQGPYLTGVAGGVGGAPGNSAGGAGNHGGNGAEQQVGAPGGPGPSIDGVSYVKKTGTGDLLGSEIN